MATNLKKIIEEMEPRERELRGLVEDAHDPRVAEGTDLTEIVRAAADVLAVLIPELRKVDEAHAAELATAYTSRNEAQARANAVGAQAEGLHEALEVERRAGTATLVELQFARTRVAVLENLRRWDARQRDPAEVEVERLKAHVDRLEKIIEDASAALQWSAE